MVEIRYSDYHEVADLAGRTVSEAREQFQAEFGIPDKARAKLNGSKVKGSAELDTVLNDDDKVSFAIARTRTPFLVGALLLALSVTGGVFAFGYVTNSTTLAVTAAGGDFASVTANTSDNPDWTPWGLFKGQTGAGTLFDVNTDNVNYPGDLVVTVSLANADDLVKAYRVLSMFLEIYDSDGAKMDINADSANNTKDFALLTLSNGAVDMFINQDKAGGDQYTVKLKSGYYVSHIWGLGWGGKENPILYCEVAQR